MTFTEWMDENWEEENINPPPLNAQIALDFLSDYLIGDEILSTLPISDE